jgi:phage-related protein
MYSIWSDHITSLEKPMRKKRKEEKKKNGTPDRCMQESKLGMKIQYNALNGHSNTQKATWNIRKKRRKRAGLIRDGPKFRFMVNGMLSHVGR